MRNHNVASAHEIRSSLGAGALLAEVEHQARSFVEQRPVAAVLAAIGLGIIVGRVAARY